ncbi:uncharacterized protein DUF5107 [Flavobacteriaceae bacterium MAR_2009_75]|nr:uncharacterized protein DUF5107 [Flavobacteriaceae bacterium MAR_2009_75]
MKFSFSLFALLMIQSVTLSLCAQSASISEEIQSLETYGFGKPNPVPILTENPKIFPYFKFEEYEHQAKKQDWKVVTLENDFVKVMVLPEIGGKVWGAIEKSTGEEFLYKNDVIKFRNIAMRGPWTSGGIEFNFGIIGHHPNTATSVDYLTKENEDGSVSCIVGAIDLPSNTMWQVEIRLEKDKAYFETNASWYNASPLTQSYYNWMTGAAEAKQDLEFFIPGNAFVEHNGDARSWPIDSENRNLSYYKNNNFGPAKSYHIVGDYNDFFGGYYHDSNFGFGQWAPYEEMPGQKLWIWSLSRSGGIWEDLLTDSDGQYIEFQAGRLFDQYFPGEVNPISQVGFQAYASDRWSEIWFPYKQIGGMVDASPHGVLNVEHDDGKLKIGINPLQKLNNTLKIDINGKRVVDEVLSLNTMEIYSRVLEAKSTDKVEVVIEGTELSYSSNLEINRLKRPFEPDTEVKISKTEQLLFDGTEAMEFREFKKAEELLKELVSHDPYHQSGLVKLAELEYRKTNYDRALAHANTVLKLDTYNSGANYIAGISYRAQNDTINALESLGWAARDMKYRSVAYAQMAELYLASKNYLRADNYAKKALDFNTYNLNARKVKLATARKKGNSELFEIELEKLRKIAPLSHFANFEEQFKTSKNPNFNVHNEFPAETNLTLALEYKNLGLADEALQILSLQAENTKNALWSTYLQRASTELNVAATLKKIAKNSIELVFPYRRETLPILKWVVEQNESWKFKYYLAQNYIAVGHIAKGETILKEIGFNADSAIFYLFRAKMLGNRSVEAVEADYKRALELNANDWKVWEENILFYLESKKFEQAYRLSKKAFKRYPNNYNIGLAHSKALLNVKKYQEVIDILLTINVLPYEHASESRKIYERAHLALAKEKLEKKHYKEAIAILHKSKEWPENIGVGKPYDPDERAQNYLLALASDYIGETEKNLSALKEIIDYTELHSERNTLNHLYGLLAYKKLGETEKLNQLLQELKTSSEGQSKETNLALALFEQNKKKMEEVKAVSKITHDMIEVAQWAVRQ